MEANYVHKDSTTLIQDKLVKNELNQIELQYNALKQQKFNELLKENQELNKQLDKAHDELYTLKNKYNIRLLNQLSENIEPDLEDFYLAEIESKSNDYDKYKTRQKEFIKYLEGMLDTENDIFSVVRVKDVLSKYKEIIGDDK